MRILNPPREHGPAHVHVVTGNGAGTGEVVIELGQLAGGGNSWGPVNIREVKGMRNADIVAAVHLVEDHVDELRIRWRQIHGED